MSNKSIIIVLIGLFIASFSIKNEYIFIVPKNGPKPHYDFTKNILSENKIELGRKLFYDPILSRDNKISCASCHSQFTAFTHVDHALSHGIEDKIGTRNSPALMNLAWHKSFMWDGAINHLDMQALAPMSNPLEMDNKIGRVVASLQQTILYPKLYQIAFGDSIITGEHTLKAISQFMLTLISANSKYDSVMRKQIEFTVQEKNGFELFQKHCGSCHKQPLFTNLEFENDGLPVEKTLNDYGRMNITKDAKDSLLFKVPTLRNIEFSYPYMHDGRFKKLSEVMNHYASGIQQSKTLSKQLQKKIVLTSNEKADIIAFLLTLSDKEFLFNPKYGFRN